MRRPIDRSRAVRAAFSNVVPLLGVAVLGWPASLLLVVYWIEGGVALLRGAFQALFARQEPEYGTIPGVVPGKAVADKRGGVSVGSLPPIYPRNARAVFAAVSVLLIFWPIGGGVVATAVDTAVPVGAVLLAVAGVVIGHAAGLVEYLRSERYAGVSVRLALFGRSTVGVLVFGVAGAGLLSIVSAPSAVLLAVVSLKFVADLLIGDGEETDADLTGWDGESSEVETPDGSPTATFRADRQSLLARAAGFGPLYLLVPPYLFAAAGAVSVGLFVGPGAGVSAFGVAVVVTAVAVAVRTDIEVGHLEYRVYRDRIVAYDTLLDAPQWALKRKTIEDATVASSVFDPIRPGTRTVVVSTFGDDRRLRALERPEAFVAAVTADR